jgi:hypothetical protein
MMDHCFALRRSRSRALQLAALRLALGKTNGARPANGLMAATRAESLKSGFDLHSVQFQGFWRTHS